jgi:hypothetical protein
MIRILRAFGGIIAGLLVAFVLVIMVELFSSIVHPLPADFGNTQEEMCLHVERYPAWVLAVALLMWAGTALAGVWTAGRVGNRGAAWTVGLMILAALTLNLSMLPYPLWFKLGCLVAIPLGIACGVLLSQGSGAGSAATWA